MPNLNVIRSPELTPYWPRPPERYAGDLPARTGVLVIGGGITGVSLMHHLRARGTQSALVERAHIAAGASGRNAGFLLAGVADSYADAVRTYGRSRAQHIWQMTLEKHDLMIEAIAGQPVGYRRLGSATLASSEKEAALLEESEQLLRDGEVDPAAVVGALARQAPLGAIRECVNVTAIEADGTGVIV